MIGFRNFCVPLLIGLLSACSSQKNTPKTKYKTIIVKDTVSVKQTNTFADSVDYAQNTDYNIDFSLFPSPNQNNRIRFLVMHYTNADFDRSAKLLTGEIQREVSSHYLIGDQKDSKIHLLVNEQKRSWHAGLSHWRNREALNDTSIGIEIVNIGFTRENGEEVWYDYPKHQIKKVGQLAKDIVERYGIDPTNVVGHSDVAPQRKFDPGPKFPWKELYQKYQVGAWYNESDKEFFNNQYQIDYYNKEWFVKNVQKDLQKYGYKINVTGDWDKQTKNVLVKFQHHFRPNNFNGVLDQETWAILKALLKKYRS